MEAKFRVVRDTQVVVHPRVWVSSLVDLSAPHPGDGTCGAPSHTRILDGLSPAEEVVVPGVRVSRFEDLDAVVAVRDSS